LTLELFLAIFLPITFFLYGLLIYYLRDIEKTVGRFESFLDPLRATMRDRKNEIADVIKESGVDGLVEFMVKRYGTEGLVKMLTEKKKTKKEPEDPLAPEKVRRRDQLLERSKVGGLAREETIELKNILDEEARIAFQEGVIGLLAFLGLLFLIGLFIEALRGD
jgi:hypothetical protein